MPTWMSAIGDSCRSRQLLQASASAVITSCSTASRPCPSDQASGSVHPTNFSPRTADARHRNPLHFDFGETANLLAVLGRPSFAPASVDPMRSQSHEEGRRGHGLAAPRSAKRMKAAMGHPRQCEEFMIASELCLAQSSLSVRPRDIGCR